MDGLILGTVNPKAWIAITAVFGSAPSKDQFAQLDELPGD
jgi:hypothetical protein